MKNVSVYSLLFLGRDTESALLIAELRASETYCVFQLQHQATSDDARAGQGSAPAAMVDVGVLEASKKHQEAQAAP